MHCLDRIERTETCGLSNQIRIKGCYNNNSTLLPLSLLSFRKYLLKYGNQDDIKSDHVRLGSIQDVNTTVLHLAVGCNLYDVIERLLEDGADPNLYNDDGQTPLHLAVASGDIKAVQILVATNIIETTVQRYEQYRPFIKKFSDVNKKELHSWDTCLCMSLRQGDDEITELLIDHGADVNMFNGFYQCPLILACKSNKVQIVDKLLSAGAKTNVIGCVGGNRQTPLGVAAKYNFPDVAKVLVIHGADVSLGDDIGPCPLAVAAAFDSTDVIEFLLRDPTIENLNINIPADNGDTILHTVINCRGDNRLKLVQRLVSLGTNVNQSNKLKHYPLHDAIHLDDIAMICLLLELGANMYTKDGLGNNALHICALLGNLQIAKLLIARGMDVNQKNFQNESSLFLAMNCCNLYMIDLLIDCGINLSLESYLFEENIEQSDLPKLLKDKKDMLLFFVQLARVPRNLFDICLHAVRRQLVGNGMALSASETRQLEIPAGLLDDLLFRQFDL